MSKSTSHAAYMEFTLSLAEKAFQQDEVPVAAILVGSDGVIFAQSTNSMHCEANPLQHAEMQVLYNFFTSDAKHAYPPEDCRLYVTLEPCPMCAGALAHARIGHIIYGAYDPKGGGIEHGPQIFNHPQAMWQPEIIGGVLEQECSTLLKRFFATKRKKT